MPSAESSPGSTPATRRWPSGSASRAPVPRSGRLKAPRAGLAVGAGAVWVTNGSGGPDPGRSGDGDEDQIRRPGDPDRSGSGRRGGVDDQLQAGDRRASALGTAGDRPIPIAARAGDAAPAPIAVAASSQGVWVLNDNTATVTEIDPRTLEVADTIALDYERVPGDIAAAAGSACVANGDGTLARIRSGAGEGRGDRGRRSARSGGRKQGLRSGYDHGPRPELQEGRARLRRRCQSLWRRWRSRPAAPDQ